MKYPVGVQNFDSLRKEGFLYIDKTSMIYQIAQGGRYYFLSRPRRFGKSLLISTMEAYFKGQRELFDGLKLAELETEWMVYPVLHLDLNAEKYDTKESLDVVLDMNLNKWEKEFEVETQGKTLSSRFKEVIRRAYEKTGMKVVVLVDEYDKPLLQTIDHQELQDDYRATLKAFYGVLKSSDQYIKLAFLTGVTHFGKVSVFSDLNNLEDISMLPQYVELCGITDQEIRHELDAEVQDLATANNLSKETCYAKLKEHYDGYHFSPNTVGIYNPFSLLCTLKNNRFGDYWFETGTPTFLVELLKKSEYDLNNLTHERVTGDVINSIDSMEENPIPVLYQSGYLTIHGYDERFRKYLLGFPNKEVELGFINFIAPYYTGMKPTKAEFYVENFIEDIETGQPEKFMKRLQAMFADTDYRLVGKAELYFHNATMVFFKMLGFYIQVERPTSDGRMDMVLQTPDYIYIFESKLDETADVALRQIETRGYAKPFSADPRQLYKIGVSFSSQTRDIADWKVE